MLHAHERRTAPPQAKLSESHHVDCQPSLFPRSLLQTQRHDGFTSSRPWGGHCDAIAWRCVSDQFAFRLPGQIDVRSTPFWVELMGLSHGSTGPRHFSKKETDLTELLNFLADITELTLRRLGSRF